MKGSEMTSRWETFNSNWNDLLVLAEPFVRFLEGGDFFSQKYTGSEDAQLIKNGELVIEMLTNDESGIPLWGDIKKTGLDLPQNWESFSYVDYHLQQNNVFDFRHGNFHGAVEKLTTAIDKIDILCNEMYGDIHMIFQCYANDYFPPIWEKILYTYLHDGFPCGWINIPPGKMMVFSNF